MAATFDAASNSSALDMSDVTSLTWSHTCTGTELAIGVGVAAWDATAADALPSGITYAAVALTNIGTAQDNGNSIAMRSKAAPATGANNVVVTMAGICSEVGAWAVSATGVDQTTPTGTIGTGMGTSLNASSTAPTVGADDLVWDVLYANDGGGAQTWAVDAGQTQRANFAIVAGSKCLGSTQLGSSGGVMSWTESGGAGDPWVSGSVRFIAAAAGTKLFRPAEPLTGIGSGGPFFKDPLQYRRLLPSLMGLGLFARAIRNPPLSRRRFLQGRGIG